MEQMTDINEILKALNTKYVDRLVDAKCSVCGATTKAMQGETEILCECCTEQKKELKERLKKIDYIIPLGYRDMSFENFINRSDVKNLDEAVKIAKRFVYSNSGFYLHGSSGQGKTHLLIATLRECILQGKSVKLLKYSSELKNYKDRGIKKEDFFEEYSGTEFLFIDDFGSIGSKDDAIDILFGILQRRIENKKGKKVFITANMPLKDIEDDRVKSRIVGMCTDYQQHENEIDVVTVRNIVELGGKDIRLNGLI